MSSNGIAHLSTKHAKQVAKLAIAQATRQGYNVAANGAVTGNFDSTQPYYRANNILSITELPTQYTGNAQALIDNPNSSGLLINRPWIALTGGGVYQYSYSGYWNQDTTYLPNATSTSSKVATSFTITSESTTKSEWLMGYLLANYTGTWTFSMYADDGGSLWIGPKAITGYTLGNALIDANVSTVTGTINLVAGVYYPIMVMYGNNNGPGSLQLQYSHTGQSLTNVPSSMLFYNPVTNGI